MPFPNFFSRFPTQHRTFTVDARDAHLYRGRKGEGPYTQAKMRPERRQPRRRERDYESVTTGPRGRSRERRGRW